ncbi:hypothetical protein Naga_100006g19 [Nannochloropsis gaditana]|uniref:Uncharacterized protein n=1 Tax=Nannochloropsis gaditana TaxID=72520 RepID=W7TTV3_9STRA|nr:hypothetical protein Naga_100006g19 [Nannochloropsis gaditana]
MCHVFQHASSRVGLLEAPCQTWGRSSPLLGVPRNTLILRNVWESMIETFDSAKSLWICSRNVAMSNGLKKPMQANATLWKEANQLLRYHALLLSLIHHCGTRQRYVGTTPWVTILIRGSIVKGM